jgi:hypothetical protein
MLVFNKYFYKNEKSKLCFGDRVVVLNDFFYRTGGSMMLCPESRDSSYTYLSHPINLKY